MIKIKLDNFLDFKYLSEVKFSPDEKNICFIQHEADIDDNSYKSYLFVYKLNEKKLIKLTTLGKENNFIWLDNESILFKSNREKNIENNDDSSYFYKININGGESERLFSIDKKVLSIKKINDNKFVIVCENYLNLDSKKNNDINNNYKIFEEIPFWANGEKFISGKRKSMYIFNIENNNLQKVTNNYTEVYSYDVINNKIVYISREYKSKWPIKTDMFVYDIKNKKIKNLSNNLDGIIENVFFLNEEKVIFTYLKPENKGLNENRKFFIMDIKSESFKCITPNLDISLNNTVATDCKYGSKSKMKFKDGWIYFITTIVKNSYLFRINEFSKIEKIIINTKTVDDFDVSKNNIIYTGFKDFNLQELYLYDFQNTKKITEFNNIKNYFISIPQRIRIETETDTYIDGWIMKPINYEKNKKYPTILNIHGGPKVVYGDVYYHEMQYWANEGYAVIYCNPRGSDGRGNEFSNIIGKAGIDDYNDIIKFVNHIINNYDFVDKNKLGVTGGSYGGFMTNWIIGHTNMFKAAVSQRSISNWISKALTTDIGYYFVTDQHVGEIDENIEKLWFHSPLKYNKKVKTPTLFIHSSEDYRCYMVEGFQMFTALKMRGVDSRFVLFEGENHELSRSGKPKSRIKRLEEITKWFNKYLK